MARWDWLKRSRLVCTLTLGLSLAGGSPWPVWAQNITLDSTFGPAQTLTGPDYLIRQQDGWTVGNNLFHSFGRFSLANGEVARFQSDVSIRNILSRVTGGTPSVIDGLIFTNSARVNLFLMNPSGIIFGPNARLDVGGANRGSFIATTLDAITFPDGTQFSATHFDQDNRLLTVVGDPSGFIATQRVPAGIRVTGSELTVYEGQSLLLVGGEIAASGATLTVAPGLDGRIELGGIAQTGAIGLATNGNTLSLDIPAGVSQPDITLSDRTELSVVGEARGSIAIHARNLTLTNSSLIGGIAAFSGSLTTKAGDITLTASETLTLVDSTVTSIANVLALGDTGDLRLTARSLQLTDSFLTTLHSGVGKAGDIILTGTDAVFQDNTMVRTNSLPFVLGRSGNIAVQGKDVTLTNRSLLSTDSILTGQAGSLTVTSDQLTLNQSQLSVTTRGDGNAGNLTVNTGRLVAENGSQILALTTGGRGNAGNIQIAVQDTTLFSGVGQDGTISGIFSSVERGARGNGGNIQLSTGSLTLLEGALINASTYGQGNAGNVTITARDQVVMDGVGGTNFSAGAFSTVERGAIGQGGNVTITAGSLALTNGGTVNASTFGTGSSGNVTLQVREGLWIDGVGTNGFSSGAFSVVGATGNGTGGIVNVETNSLVLSQGGVLSSSTFGVGDAGNVIVNATNQIAIDGVGRHGFASGIYSRVAPTATGQGGAIDLTTRSLLLSQQGGLFSESTGNGNPGNIRVMAQDEIRLAGGVIDSSVFPTPLTEAVKGGDVTLQATRIALDAGVIAATAGGLQSRGGNIQLRATDSVNLAQRSRVLTQSQAIDSGIGGDITVQTNTLEMNAGSRLSASSVSGITPLDPMPTASNLRRAGNIDITATNVRLDSRGEIDSETTSGNGGNIRLTVRDILLLRRESRISTTAGTQQTGGDGGNIDIDAQFIVGVRNENSDIVANAFTGRGGNIQINAQAVLGLQFRPRLTAESDITASSTFGFSGLVTINTPNVDPNRGLVPLPIRLEDASRLMRQTCAPRGSDSVSSFVATGRGGVPISPLDPLQTEATLSTWVTVEELPGEESSAIERSNREPGAKPGEYLTEAQGWQQDGQGNVYLVAMNTMGQPTRAAIAPLICP